jgi:thioredoxin 1
MSSCRRQILIVLLLAWVCLSPGLPLPARAAAAPGPLPEILEFDRKFCPICAASERVILAVRDKYPGQFTVRKFYIDEDEKVFRRYRVAIVPTQVFRDAGGKEVGRHEGVFKEEVLIQKLRDLKFIKE